MPPTQITGSPWQSAWNSTTSPKKAPTASTFAVSVGDLLVVMAADEDTSNTFGTNPTNAAASPAAITWTKQQEVTASFFTRVAAWTGQVTSAGDVQVSLTKAGSGDYGLIVWAFSSHGGVGQTQKGNNQSTAPSITPAAPWTAHSTVCCTNGDWTAASWGATRSYLTNLGAATERNYAAVDGNYTSGAWEHTDSGASPGSGAVGLSTPTMKWSLVAVEVLAPVGGSTPVSNVWALHYDIANAVSTTRAIKYDILNAVSRAWGLSYDVQNAISRQWAVIYDIANSVSRAWAINYDIASTAVSVSNAWAVKYNIANTVALTTAIAYDIANAIARAWSLSYDIQASVSQQVAIAYDIVNGISRQWALKYDVSNSVSHEWFLQYNIGEVLVALIVEIVSATRPHVWQGDVYTVGRRR